MSKHPSPATHILPAEPSSQTFTSPYITTSTIRQRRTTNNEPECHHRLGQCYPYQPTRYPKFRPPAETIANTTLIFINHHQRSQHQKPVTVFGPVCPCSNLIPPLQPNYRARVDRPTRTSQTTTIEPLSPHRLTSSLSRRPDPQPPGHPAPLVRPGTPRASPRAVGTACRTTTEIPAVEPALLVHVFRVSSRRKKISNAGTSPLRPSPPSPTGGTVVESFRRPPARRVLPEVATPRQDPRVALRESLHSSLAAEIDSTAAPHRDQPLRLWPASLE
ncbi:Uncharacterized protein M6B38_248545 [Iris pallida]|uniref:Uncharacterized protein n=1 Tax=Iris pallida TaxID=29817 RepID=A0AAX6DGL1_IRIPA|nr:Uncharacterized protein M6B38_248545 [Iris pallida]